MKKRHRPKKIIIWFEDQFTGRFVGSMSTTYNPIESAAGGYSRFARLGKAGLNKIYPEILQNRKPLIRVKLIY